MSPQLLRAAPWRASAGLTLAAAGLGAGGLAIGEGGMRVLQLALVLVGGAAACVLDEAAAAVVGACPLPRRVQVLARALAAVPALVVGAGLVGLWWVLEGMDHLVLLEAAGCWVLGFALAVVTRHWLDEPAEVVVSGLVLVLVSVMLVAPLGRRIPLFPLGESPARTLHTWWLVVGCCLGALVVVVREWRWRVR